MPNGGAKSALGEAADIAKEALPGPAGEAVAAGAEVLEWLGETLNQWKLKMVVSIVGIIILIPLMNAQFFLANLVGIRIPKLLPKMPWWEIMIMGMLDLGVLTAVILASLPILILPAIGCMIKDIWGGC